MSSRSTAIGAALVVCPGLMRTGSPRNALFKGQHQREYAWFSISDSLPLLAMSVERAANRILRTCRRGSAQLVLGTHTKAAVLLNELFPGVTASLSSFANRLLPGPTSSEEAKPGHQSQSRWAPSWLTALTDAPLSRTMSLCERVRPD